MPEDLLPHLQEADRLLDELRNLVGQLDEENAGLRRRAERAEADAAALQEAAGRVLGAWGAEDSCDDEMLGLQEVCESADHPGDSLLAELTAARVGHERRRFARLIAGDPRWLGGYAGALALLRES